MNGDAFAPRIATRNQRPSGATLLLDAVAGQWWPAYAALQRAARINCRGACRGAEEVWMDNERLGRNWMIFVGVALLAGGVIGFLGNNPLASESESALLRVNAVHNIVHLGTGALALAIGLGTRGATLANGLIGFGVLYAAVTLLLIVDPTLFGLFASAPANAGDHILHAAIAIVSIALGYMLRQRAVERATR
jgi:hypothetical protein